jgi:hypothetical protein
MKRISVNITDEQHARLEAVQKNIGVPVSLQVRKALDMYFPTSEWLAENKRAQETSAATGGPAVAPHWTEDETILSRNQAQEIAQKIGKPLEELYERVPAQKPSAEPLLEGFLEIL